MTCSVGTSPVLSARLLCRRAIPGNVKVCGLLPQVPLAKRAKRSVVRPTTESRAPAARRSAPPSGWPRRPARRTGARRRTCPSAVSRWLIVVSHTDVSGQDGRQAADPPFSGELAAHFCSHASVCLGHSCARRVNLTNASAVMVLMFALALHRRANGLPGSTAGYDGGVPHL